MARNIVRGIDPSWTKKIYGFALIPDIIFYLKADITTLVTRIVHGRGFDFWESGMDILKEDNLYDGFVKYQSYMIKQFDSMASEFNFVIIDANSPINIVFEELQSHIKKLLD